MYLGCGKPRSPSEEEIQTLVLELSLLVSSLGPKHAGEEENQIVPAFM